MFPFYQVCYTIFSFPLARGGIKLTFWWILEVMPVGKWTLYFPFSLFFFDPEVLLFLLIFGNLRG